MARFSFALPTLPGNPLVRLDTDFDTDTPVTDLLIGSPGERPALSGPAGAGFHIGTAPGVLGPDAVDTLYLKQLDYRGTVVGYPIELAGAGSGGPAPLLHIAFPFAFDTAGLSDGIEVTGWTPAVGDVVRDGWISIAEAWDGTTPQGDVIIDGAGDQPWFTHYSAVYDMTIADQDGSNGLSSPGNSASLFEAFWDQGGGVVTTAAPLILWVSADGSRGGADPGAAQGQAILHLLILPSADPNP